MLSALGFRCLIWIVRWTPFPILYGIADILSWFLQHIFHYRKQTIAANLEQAFPNSSTTQRQSITKLAYKNLSDSTLESLKGPYLKAEALKARMYFKNPEILPADQHVLLVGGHQGNWEWGGLAVTLWFKQQIAGVYKPLKNKNIDRYFRNTRAKWGLRLFSMRGCYKFLKENSPPTILVLIADQSPGNAKTSYWTSFFNKMTGFNVGPEKIARMKNWPVYFYEVVRVKRGYYEVTFHLLAENPSELKDGAITAAYRDALEQSISKHPASWLWSHKRWKREMPAGVKVV